MRKLLLFGLLGLTLAPGAPMEAAPKKRVAASLTWPTFRQVESKKSVPEVAALQYLLRWRGFYKPKPDGIFGAQTAASVRAFQHKNGLKTDGVVGGQTFARLVVPLKRGSRGDAVRALQTLLRDVVSEVGTKPFQKLPVDGVLGFQTEKTLRAFQGEWGIYFRDGGIEVDGMAGAQTWCALFGGRLQ